MLRIVLNEDKELVKEIRTAIKKNGGYCICSAIKEPDTQCLCKNFREQKCEGYCHCGLYKKINEEK